MPSPVLKDPPGTPRLPSYSSLRQGGVSPTGAGRSPLTSLLKTWRAFADAAGAGRSPSAPEYLLLSTPPPRPGRGGPPFSLRGSDGLTLLPSTPLTPPTSPRPVPPHLRPVVSPRPPRRGLPRDPGSPPARLAPLGLGLPAAAAPARPRARPWAPAAEVAGGFAAAAPAERRALGFGAGPRGLGRPRRSPGAPTPPAQRRARGPRPPLRSPPAGPVVVVPAGALGLRLGVEVLEGARPTAGLGPRRRPAAVGQPLAVAGRGPVGAGPARPRLRAPVPPRRPPTRPGPPSHPSGAAGPERPRVKQGRGGRPARPREGQREVWAQRPRKSHLFAYEERPFQPVGGFTPNVGDPF